LREFALSSGLCDHLNLQLAAIHNPRLQKPGPVGETFWEIASYPELRMSLLLQDSLDDLPPLTLESWPGDRLFVCMWPQSTEVARYRAPDVGDVFDPGAMLESLGSMTMARGVVVRARANEDVIDLWPPGRRGLFLEVAGPTRGSVMGAYDPRTLRAIAPIAADKGDASLEYMAWTLAAMGDPRSARVVSELMEHPAHFVRWTAVRAAMELDEEVGMALLERASRDPHPHVRKAAARALEACARPADDPVGGNDGLHD
jgi:hypothetical protein